MMGSNPIGTLSSRERETRLGEILFLVWAVKALAPLSDELSLFSKW